MPGTADGTVSRGTWWMHARPVWVRRLRDLRRSEPFVTAALAVLTAALLAAALVFPSWTTPTIVVIPVLIGASLLPMTWLLVVVGIAFTAHCVILIVTRDSIVGVGTLVIFAVITGIVLVGARPRSRLGVQGSVGASMLFDLRERLAAQGEMPPLPAGWQAEVVYRSAHDDSFGGDFLVASLSTDGKYLEIVLVDVSGKGMEAGTRALLLSGAFGGILGSVRPSRFLPAANQYLLRQGWAEGFATAVHVSLDLTSGQFEIYSAGHPPLVQFHAGSGRWVLAEVVGPALGLVENADYVGAQGTLLQGDALLAYTDGLVETPDRDIAIGIDRLLGAAERLVTGGFARGARGLIDAVPLSESDDRALVVLWRQ